MAGRVDLCTTVAASSRQSALSGSPLTLLLLCLTYLLTIVELIVPGETVDVQVCAEVMPSFIRSKTPTEKLKERGNSPVLQRWKDRFEGARVHIRVEEVVVSETDIKAASSSAPSLSPILRQETQVSHVVEGTAGEGDGVVVVLKARLDLKVCREFWDRPLLLVVHMAPKEGAVQVAQGDNDDDVSLDIRDRESFGPLLLQDEYASAQLVSLTREQAQPTLLMTRRVEQHIVVTKPLRLALESRELAGQRVGILARVSNRNRSLALSVRNLRLHLDQSLSAQNAEMCRFRIVGSDKVLIPVVLQPQERYSFLFVLEPAETSMLHASPGLEGDNEVKVAPSVLDFATTSTPQRTSLTLSWKPITGSVNATTETCTIDWHPKVPSEVFTSLLNGGDKLRICIRKLVTNLLQHEKTLCADFKCVRLLPNSVLQMTVAPFASSVSIGVAVPASVTVVNRSLCTGFDLTLVHPSQVTDVMDGNNCAAPVVVGFEGSQRLGFIRPGMSVEQSMHIVFLRSGMCRLGPIVLVDHLTHTCFVSDDWNVFVDI